MLLILILGDLAVWARLNLCIKDLIILHVRLDAAISIDKSDKYTFYTPSITLKEHSAIFKSITTLEIIQILFYNYHLKNCCNGIQIFIFEYFFRRYCCV